MTKTTLDAAILVRPWNARTGNSAQQALACMHDRQLLRKSARQRRGGELELKIHIAGSKDGSRMSYGTIEARQHDVRLQAN